jgi:hypothetical protein
MNIFLSKWRNGSTAIRGDVDDILMADRDDKRMDLYHSTNHFCRCNSIVQFCLDSKHQSTTNLFYTRTH